MIENTDKIYGVIYKFTNRKTEKCYIGQTINFNKRKRQHFRDAENNRFNTKFHKAIREYGIENFIVEILCECYSEFELYEREIYYIKEYNSNHNGYNMTFGGDGIDSETIKEINNRPEKRRKHSEFMKGRKISDETRQKMSDAKKGKTGEKCPLFGRKYSIEIKKKMSDAKKGKHPSDEHRKNLSKSLMGKKLTSETIDKITKIMNDKHSKKVKCFNNETHEEIIFNSRSECAKYFNKSGCKISSIIIGYCKNSLLPWTFEYIIEK